jgi:CHAD domain-containing protein
MAFRLRPGHSFGKELSRISAHELGRAIDTMRHTDDRAEAVHQARKCVKKLRAVLRLLERPLRGEYRRHNIILRAAAHRLSVPRDAAAMLHTIAALRQRYPDLVTSAIVEAMSHRLAIDARTKQKELRSNRIEHDLRCAVKTLPAAVRVAGTKKSVHVGLVHGFERAHKAMRRANLAPDDRLFHTWRRRVKDHWYQMRLMAGIDHAARARAVQLKRLETWLGDDHDLVVLKATLLKSAQTYGNQRGLVVVLGCAEHYQFILRKRATRLGGRLFAASKASRR